MEELIKMLPGGAVTITLAVLAAIRVGIGIIDRTIAKTPDKHDDAGWAKIRTSFAFILLEEILEGFNNNVLQSFEIILSKFKIQHPLSCRSPLCLKSL